MSTRIIFNGQEYAGPEAMPDEVRRAYEAALARLTADSDKNGVPDVLEGAQPATGVPQVSVVVNGRQVDVADLPAPARSLLRYAVGFLAGAAPRADPSPNPTFMRTLDSIQDKLGAVLQILSVVVAGGVIVVGTWMIRHMDASSRSQGGAVYVGIAMTVAVAWAAGMFVSASRRRKP
jgi:hypothetical protein